MVTLDIWEILQKANEICGIFSLVVSIIALFKVSAIQKQIRIDNKMDFGHKTNLKQSARGRENFQVGGNFNAKD